MNLSRVLVITAAVGTGIAGGVFFAFSTFVMHGLGRLPDRDGLLAMNAINQAAPTPVFMALLFGTAAVCVVIGASALRHLGEPGTILRIVGCAVYLVTAIALTAAYHVPHNDALAALDPSSPGAGAQWRTYLSHWTAWNHVRTIGCIVSAVAFTLAARVA
jgi:uncharacterized membrane protein